MKIRKYLNLAKKDKDGLVPIWFSITANGWQHRFSIGEKVYPANFDGGMVTKKQSGYSSINAKINSLYTYLDTFGAGKGRSLTKSQVVEHLQKYREEERIEVEEEKIVSQSFFTLFREWITHQQTKIKLQNGKRLSPKTVSALRSTMDRLEAFEKASKYKLSLDRMDQRFYSKFLSYMIDDLDQSSNTFAKHIKRLKTFLYYCEDELELAVNKKFKKFETIEKYDEVDFLYEYELMQIRSLRFEDLEMQIQAMATEELGKPLNDLQIKQRITVLNEMRDVFLFCCYTGLRKSDVFTLSPKHIHGDLIVKKAGKTDVTCYIPFFDDDLFKPVEIINRYKGKFETCLPVNQSINEYLQDIAKLCGITRIHLTTKIGRKTFVTLKRYQGVDDRTIMKSTGHQTEKSYLRYAGTDTTKMIEEFKRKGIFKVA